MKPAAGMRISEKVKLVKPLGVGGMGKVWVARHLSLDSDVAVKFIAKSDWSERHLKRFKREASLAAKIKSPHVVRIFDFGTMHEGTPYIVMELLAGECLADRLSDAGRMSLQDTALMVSQVSVALREAHGLGIVHRDIKPGNIFLVESGYQLFVKLLDFGVAKQTGVEVHNVTSTGAIVGTPHYMSPEQLLSTKDVDQRADLWALAVVAYHSITGRVPFAGKTMAALSMSITEGRFTPVSALVQDAGPELDMWFKLALCRNIRGRYNAAEDLANSFVDAVEGAADRESALIPRSTRPSQLDAAGIRVSDSGHVTIAGEELPADEPSEDATDSDPPSQSTIGDATMTAERDPIDQEALLVDDLAIFDTAPADGRESARRKQKKTGDRTYWLVVVVAAAAFVVSRTWGFWRGETAEVTPDATTTTAAATTPEPLTTTLLPSVPAPTTTTSTAEPDPALSASSPRPTPPPAAAPNKTPSAKPPGPDCSEPFIVDEHGDIHPRPECLR